MMHKCPVPIVVISGPTASGKTALALQLAQHFPIEVISADSCQVYRQMDIGTAKASLQEQAAVAHHLIDVVDPDQDFSVATFTRLAHQAIADIVQRHKLPVVVGGAGLYIRALTEGLVAGPAEDVQIRSDLLMAEQQQPGTLYRRLVLLDPAAAQRLHPNDVTRIVRALEVFMTTGKRLSCLQHQHGFNEQPYRTLKFGLAVDRALLYERINARVLQMVETGLLVETRQLLDQGYRPDLKAMKMIGYRRAVAHLQGELALSEAVSLIQQDSRRYAKRQMTWFRKDNSIIWVDYNSEFDSIRKWIENFYLNAD